MGFSKFFATLLYSALELIIGAQLFTLVSTFFCSQVKIFQFCFVSFYYSFCTWITKKVSK
jgi:hypothetical protein